MARYTGAVCKLCRREGTKLFLKGERCFTKCIIDKKKAATAPGQRTMRRGKMSEYSKRLRQKQIARRVTGVLERQFRRYFKAAEKMKGMTGENLLLFLETRLDNVVRRLGFATSLAFARQLVTHGHVKVNNSVVDLPSYQARPGDIISLSETVRSNPYVRRSLQVAVTGKVLEWLELDADLVKIVSGSDKDKADLSNIAVQGKMKAWPDRSEMSYPVTEQLIVELYSK